ncbi:MAG: hypothetical protein ABIR91_02880 [Candidatus Saccharimonadales bacterium]
MKNPVTTTLAFRQWENPSAEKKYRRKVVAFDQRQEEEIDRLTNMILETVAQHKRIKMDGISVDILLLRIAELGGLRLYNESIDGKQSAYAKQRQRDRQANMRQAFRRAVESGKIAYSHSELHHAAEAAAEDKPLSQPILKDGVCVLVSRFEARLIGWGEKPAEQHI